MSDETIDYDIFPRSWSIKELTDLIDERIEKAAASFWREKPPEVKEFSEIKGVAALKPLGQIAYEAWREKVGKTTLSWLDYDAETRSAWTAAAEAVVKANNERAPK